jgi:membrane protein YdbS with pleckstrin-like domain
MKKYYTDKKSLIFLRVVTLIIIICIICGLKFLMYYFQQKYPNYFITIDITIPEIVVWSLIAVFVTAYVLFILIILPLWYTTVSYALTDEEIIAKYGLFAKVRQYMKLSAVQYITRLSFPFSKYTSFNFIFVNALGGRLVLMFLSDKDANEITSQIDKYLKSRAGLL